MIGRSRIHAIAIVTALVAASGALAAQAGGSDPAALRARIERRFDVLPLRDGFALRPKSSATGVRTVEVTGDAIAIDGQPATGAELRRRLGTDADLVLQLSYLSDAERRSLFQTAQQPAAAPPPPPPPAPPEEPRATAPPDNTPARRDDERFPRRMRRSRGDRDAVRIGGSISIGPDEIVDGDVVAVGGSAHVEGTVHGDVVAVGGSVTLGPNASVDENVVVVGGTLHRDPGARIGGRVQEVGINWPIEGFRWRGIPRGFWWGSMMGSAFALIGTLTRLAILCLLAALVVLLGRDYMERAGTRAAAEPLKAGAIGLLAALLFVPVLIITIVVLVITIVGIPLLVLIPFAILGLALVALVGFTGVAYRLGQLLSGRLGWTADNPYLTTIAGILVLLSPVLVARLLGLGGLPLFPITTVLVFAGFCAELIAWMVGFGAVALLRFSRRPPATAV